MLNIGLTEILCFSIISLLILGPEKLPEAARFAAKWYGKFKRFISNVQNQLDQELHLSEFREEIQKEINRLTEIEIRMQKQMDQLRFETQHQTPSESKKHNTSLQYIYLEHTFVAPFSTHGFIHFTNSLASIQKLKTISPTPLRIAV